MKTEDADRVSRYKPTHEEYRCMLCGERRPTCPQLVDDVWRQAWREATSRGLVETPCTCLRYEPTIHDGLSRAVSQMRPAGQHYDDPNCLRNRKRKELLCFECTERCLDRQLTLEDLEACAGNYAHFIMQTRAMQYVNRVAVMLRKPTCICGHEEVAHVRVTTSSSPSCIFCGCVSFLLSK